MVKWLERPVREQKAEVRVKVRHYVMLKRLNILQSRALDAYRSWVFAVCPLGFRQTLTRL